MFTIEGTIANQKHKVTWDDGNIFARPGLVRDLQIEAEMQGPLGTIPGPLFEGDEIFDDGIAFYVLTKRYFDEVKIIDGELPKVESVPKGAIP